MQRIHLSCYWLHFEISEATFKLKCVLQKQRHLTVLVAQNCHRSWIMVTIVTALDVKDSGLRPGRERDHRGLLVSSQARAIASERASGVKSAPNQACRSIRCGGLSGNKATAESFIVKELRTSLLSVWPLPSPLMVLEVAQFCFVINHYGLYYPNETTVYLQLDGKPPNLATLQRCRQ